MAQILIRKIDERVKARLQRRAKRNGRSMEAEAREILKSGSLERDVPEGGLGSEMVINSCEIGNTTAEMNFRTWSDRIRQW